jgi:hypothetical protein
MTPGTATPAASLLYMATVPAETTLPADYFNASLAEVDPEIAQVLELELQRQQNTLEMIASENFVPVSVLEAQGSVLTNKYAEGYPGKRYYGGCEFVDIAEQLAIDGGELPGTPSTVVDLRAYEQTGEWAILRPGAVPVEVIASALDSRA